MIFLTSFWSTFSHENGSTDCAYLHVTWKQKRTSEILFSGFWVLLTDLTVKLWGKINLKEACLWKHCCMGTKPWECSLRVIQGSCHNQNHHRQIASYFIFFFLLLTSPDNNIKVSDTTRKKVYMHIFTRVQAGTPQQPVVACFCRYVSTILRALFNLVLRLSLSLRRDG